MKGIIGMFVRKCETNWLVASDESTGFAWNRQNDDLLGIKTFIMLECRGERVTGVLNNAIWRRGVAALCRLCRIPPPYTPTPATPLHPPWLPPRTTKRRREGIGMVPCNRMLIGKYWWDFPYGNHPLDRCFFQVCFGIPEIIFSYSRTRIFDEHSIFISEIDINRRSDLIID